MPKKLTIRDLFEAKRNGIQLTEVRTDCPMEAKACEAAGIDIIMALRSALPQVRPAAPNTFIITADGVQDPEISNPDQAVAAGFRCMNEGGDAVYTSLSLKEDVTSGGYPERGHLLSIKDEEFEGFLDAIE